MDEEIKKRVEQEIASWEYLGKLPAEQKGFKFREEKRAQDDFYDIFTYHNDETRKSVTAYFHQETKEYKLRAQIGLLSFCRIEFITGKLSEFEKLLEKHLEPLLQEMRTFDEGKISGLLKDTGALSWEWGNNLPETWEGFTLFILPKEPVRVAGGSYCLLDYSDFSIDSNFCVFYNIFRDEFFVEYRLRTLPTVTYDFDAKHLEDLEQKLRAHMEESLKNIRVMAEKQEIE